MAHKYYSEDSEERKSYFDNHFRRLAGHQTTQIIDLSSFRQVLENAFDKDASLSEYLKNMSEDEIILFYERPMVQSMVQQNISAIPKEEQREIFPIHQKQKKTYDDKAFVLGTRKGQRTFGYPTKYSMKGKTFTRYRDVKGRFIAVKKDSEKKSYKN